MRLRTLFPIFVDLSSRHCLVVGGGRVADRKARRLVAAGARVTVVARVARAGIQRLARGKKIRLLRRGFSPADLRGVFLVVCATDDAAVNARAAAAARRRSVLANVVDTPAICDFFLPAIVRRGQLQIAISTAGSSPATARLIQRELGQQYQKEYGEMLRMMRSLRPRVIKEVSPGKRAAVFIAMASPFIFDLVRHGRTAGARRAMERVIQKAIRGGSQSRRT